MALIKWSPFLSSDAWEDMDRSFSDFMPAPIRQQNFTPAVDMYEDDSNVIVETQLAGIDPEEVSISIENDVLCIKGEGEKTSEVEDKNYYRKEIKRGSFYRSIPLPAQVLGDKASAIAEEGVLKISIPKAPESKPKQIKIINKKNNK
jgi:HSP20 family protein